METNTITQAERFTPPHDRYKAQAPYSNGVVVWRFTGWNGNGFGSGGTYVAVDAAGFIVGEFFTGSDAGLAWVSADGVRAHGLFSPRTRYVVSGGRRYVEAGQKSGLAQWKDAVKALPKAGAR